MHYLNSKFPGPFRRPSISPAHPERSELETFTLPQIFPLNNDAGRGYRSPGLNLAGITAESQRRPDQDLIDKIDGVNSSASLHPHAGLM